MASGFWRFEWEGAGAADADQRPPRSGSVKLVVSIVRDQDAGRVIDALVAQEFRATRINTAGGFLKRGNATLLIGVQDEEVDDVVGIVQDVCRRDGATEIPSSGVGVLFVLPVSASYRV